MKKGFTLIELLAVIIILAIIALIATPIVLDVIEDSRISALKSSVQEMAHAIDINYYYKAKEQNFVIKNGNLYDSDNIRITNGNSFRDGIGYRKTDGKVALILFDGRYCAQKSLNDMDVKVYKASSIADCYTSYYIGETVVLKDGSEWYVMKSSDSTLTLMSKSNLDYTNGFIQEENDTNYSSSVAIPFDLANNRLTANNSYCLDSTMGCNLYEKNNITVVKNSTIKDYIDEYKKLLIKNDVITNDSIVRLVTLDELEQLGCSDNNRTSPGTCNNGPQFLKRTSYWTMDDKKNSNNNVDVWFVGSNGDLSYDMAARENVYGLRPVIEIPKYIISDLLLDNNKNTTNTNTYATWMWEESVNEIINNNIISERITELKNNGINTIYMNVNPEIIIKYKEIVSEANSQGIKVYALFGDPAFIFEENYANVIRHDMNRVAQFNNAYADIAHFEGIHYDVEYYLVNKDGVTCPDGQSEEAKSCFGRLNFIKFAREAKKYAQTLNLSVYYDVTAYTTNMVTFYDTDNTEKNVLDELIKNSDGIVVMAYGDSPKNTNYSILFEGEFFHTGGDPVINVNESYLKKLAKANIEIIVGQEIPVFENKYNQIKDNPTLAASLFPEYQNGSTNEYAFNKTFIRRMMGEINTTLKSTLTTNNLSGRIGFAFHDYKELKKLIDMAN